jgi:hypothetical protein
LTAYRKGARYDSWSEHFDYYFWLNAFKENNVGIDFYTTRQRAEDELFPWDFIDCGVSKNYLWREWQNSRENAIF